jgi:hypothetical protein
VIVTRIQLYCDNNECVSRFGGSDWKNQPHLRTRNFYPEDGPLDGAIFTMGELRKMAHSNGWTRVRLGDGRLQDVCPSCTSAAPKTGVAA